MRRAAVVSVAAVSLLLGVWEIGQGAWIYTKAHLAQYLLRRAWQHALQGDIRPKPWPWADTWTVGRLQVPSYGIDLIVLAGANGRTLAFGPAQVPVTADRHQSMTAIMTGHRDTHFRFLERLKTGDEIFLQLPSREWHRYRVSARDIVDARHAHIAQNGHPDLVLVTCYPFDAVLPGGSMRYVVTADHISFAQPTALR